MTQTPLPARQLRGALGHLRAARAELDDLDRPDDLGPALDVLENLEDQTRLLADHIDGVVDVGECEE